MSLFEEYKKSLKLADVEEVLDLIFYRPLAFIFVKSILRTNITPNHITVMAVIIGVIGALLYGATTATAFATAGILLIIYDILDCADGQLARIKHNGTPMGRVLDGLADYIVTITAYIFIGIGVASYTDNIHFYSSPLLNWLLVIAAGLSNAAHSATLDFYRNRYLDYALNRESILGDNLQEFRDVSEKLSEAKGKYFEKALIWIYLKYSNFQLKLSSSSMESERKKYDVNDFRKRHKFIMHLWTYLGPTTELSFLIVCSLLNRLDIYLWGIVTVGNAYILILYAIQTRINKSTKLSEVN